MTLLTQFWKRTKFEDLHYHNLRHYKSIVIKMYAIFVYGKNIYNKAGEQKLWKLMNMFMALIVRVLQVV